jgi:hypothetical protein
MAVDPTARVKTANNLVKTTTDSSHQYFYATKELLKWSRQIGHTH